jgi:hypothetical protein
LRFAKFTIHKAQNIRLELIALHIVPLSYSTDSSPLGWSKEMSQETSGVGEGCFLPYCCAIPPTIP